MCEFFNTVLRLRFDRRGVAAIEYGLIAALIAVAIVTALSAVATNLKATLNLIAALI